MAIEIEASTNEVRGVLTNSKNQLLALIDSDLVDNIPIVITDLQHIPTLFSFYRKTR